MEIITDKSNIKYISNFSGSHGILLLAKTKKYLLTDFRYIERAKKSVKKEIQVIELNKKNWQEILKKEHTEIIGIEEENLTLARFKKIKKLCRIKNQKIKFKNISGAIESAREIKSPAEIKLIMRSQRINEKTFLVIKKFIQDLVSPKSQEQRLPTEIEIAWKIREIGYHFCAEDISFEPIVAFGKNTSIPHHNPGKTRLKKGDIIMIDMGMKYQDFCSDMTRMIFTAPPTKLQKEVYEIVLTAQENGIKKIVSGITGKKADWFSRNIITKKGYAENYGHSGGHGIGLDIHEKPSLSEKYKETLKENSIITVEPGIYLEGKFGVRIEDMILVKKDKSINLTKVSKRI
ncbi:aminopeptidase P family protein [Candidatus Gracilibacteria bacterium]|nr:aminopeptidase P family protein [Candidatus Gracilibacteria bacterium]